MNKRIKEIDKQIKKLKKEKRQIENKIINESGTLQEKFSLWYKSSKKYYWDYFPPRDIFPKLREHMDKNNIYLRHYDYEIDDIFPSEELYAYTNSEEWKEFYDTEEEYNTFANEFTEKYTEILEEIMKGKVKSFKCDW